MGIGTSPRFGIGSAMSPLVQGLRHIALNPACPPGLDLSDDLSGIYRDGVCLLLSLRWVSRSPLNPTYGLI